MRAKTAPRYRLSALAYLALAASITACAADRKLVAGELDGAIELFATGRLAVCGLPDDADLRVARRFAEIRVDVAALVAQFGEPGEVVDAAALPLELVVRHIA